MRIPKSFVAPFALILGLGACSSGGGPDGETVAITLADNVEVGASDAKAESIVNAAEAFLTTLSDEQRSAGLCCKNREA